MTIDREELEFNFIISVYIKINLRLITIYLPRECFKIIIIQSCIIESIDVKYFIFFCKS
jgi:hypothetical protein